MVAQPAQAQVFVGAEREVTVDTGLKALRIHDGVTPGGHLVELSTNASSSRSAVAVNSTNELETVRAALQLIIDNAIAERNTAIASGDATTLSTATSYTDTAISNLPRWLT